MGEVDEDVLDLVREHMGDVRTPSHHDKVGTRSGGPLTYRRPVFGAAESGEGFPSRMHGHRYLTSLLQLLIPNLHCRL